MPREDREEDRDDDDREGEERREPLLDRAWEWARPELLDRAWEWARPELLDRACVWPELRLREGRLAAEDDRWCDDEARDGRLLGRLKLPDEREGETLRRVVERELLDGARLEGREDERLGLTDRSLLLPVCPRDVRCRAELRLGECELRRECAS